MRRVFANSYYFIAPLNPADEAHQKATSYTASFEGGLVTTDWVLAEVGDAFSRPPNRERFVRFYQQLSSMHGPALLKARSIFGTRTASPARRVRTRFIYPRR